MIIIRLSYLTKYLEYTYTFIGNPKHFFNAVKDKKPIKMQNTDLVKFTTKSLYKGIIRTIIYIYCAKTRLDT